MWKLNLEKRVGSPLKSYPNSGLSFFFKILHIIEHGLVRFDRDAQRRGATEVGFEVRAHLICYFVFVDR